MRARRGSWWVADDRKSSRKEEWGFRVQRVLLASNFGIRSEARQRAHSTFPPFERLDMVPAILHRLCFAMQLARTSLLRIIRTSAQPLFTSSRLISSTSRNMSTPPLQAQKCEPCTASLPAMSADEAKQLLSSLSGKWSLSPQPTTLLSSKLIHPDALHRTYKFKDYTSAQAFANQIGALAEAEGHHPAVMVEWGRVTVWWWSHAISGVGKGSRCYARRCRPRLTISFPLSQLHKNDFVMAAKTEELVHKAEGYTPPKPKA